MTDSTLLTNLTTGGQRLYSILNDTPGTIVFDSGSIYPGHKENANPWWSSGMLGSTAVSDNSEAISRAAAKYGVDPVLLTAVVYMENAHGYYDMGMGSTEGPGNINLDTWAGLLGLKSTDIRGNDSLNIALTAKILAEIEERLVNPTPEAIASLYNSLMRDMVSDYGLTIAKYMEMKPWLHCFPSFIPIQISETDTAHISTLKVGDVVLAFDPKGGSAMFTGDTAASNITSLSPASAPLVAARVTRLFTNVTDEWLVIKAADGELSRLGIEAFELTVTPGHEMLDGFGRFRKAIDIVNSDCLLVRDDGCVVKVQHSHVVYSAATAHLYEEAEITVARTTGGLALQPKVKRGWKTYNFEVETYHTYVAGGFRVHNDSLYAPMTGLGNLADNISGQISDFAFGKNTLASVFAGSALSAVSSTAADAMQGQAGFNAAHLGGRYLYDVAGGLGSLGGNLLMQDLISGLGIRGAGATALAQLGSGVGSVLAQNAALNIVNAINPDGLLGIGAAHQLAQNGALGNALSGQVFSALGSFAGNELAGVLGLDSRTAPLIAAPIQAGIAQVGQNLLAGVGLLDDVGGAMAGAFLGAIGGVAGSFLSDLLGLDSAAADLGGSIGSAIGGFLFGPIGSFAGSVIGSFIGEFADEVVDAVAGVIDSVKDFFKSLFPVVLDLDGNGLSITQLSESNAFIDADGSGLLHRTAWAAAGDGVLFFDPDGRNAITEQRQYVFTEWDATARGDLEAIRNVFDSNGDGKLTAADADFAKFKLMVTNPDGSQSVKTLAELNITEINLTADLTKVAYADGSGISGQTTFTRGDNSTGTVANMVFAAEAMGHAVTKTTSVDGAGIRTTTNTAYAADGAIAHVTTSVTSADGLSIANSYDWDGDGVVDQVQTIVTTVDGSGTRTETITNRNGGNVLINSTQTITNATGTSVTINRDMTGGGWYDQSETRITNGDGSRTLTLADKNADGSTIRSTTTATSIDGLMRVVSTDLDSNGAADRITTTGLVVNGDQSRVETVGLTSNNGTLLQQTVINTSTNGRTQVSATDLDGDLDVDRTETSVLTVSGDGTTNSVVTVTNGDTSLRSTITVAQSADSLSKTTAVDVNGDAMVDSTTTDVMVVNGDGSRDQTVSTFNTDSSPRSRTITHIDADRIGKTVTIDQDGNGTTDFSQVVTVDGGGIRTETVSNFTTQGALINRTVSTTSADGLSTTTTYDIDGNATTDRSMTDVTVKNVDGTSTRIVSNLAANASLTGQSVTTTSANGLLVTTQTDIDGTGGFDNSRSQLKEVFGDLSTRTTTTTLNANGSQKAQTITNASADRRTVSTTVDDNGDGAIDQTISTVTALNGTTTTAVTDKSKDGATISQSISIQTANGLSNTAQMDRDGNGSIDQTTTDVTVLNVDGSSTETIETRNNNNSLRDKTIMIVSGNGLLQTTQADKDGNGTFDVIVSDTTVLNANGSVTRTVANKNSLNAVTSQTASTTSASGLANVTALDVNGDLTTDFTTSDVTALNVDGSNTRTIDVLNGNNSLRSREVTVTSDDARTITTTRDDNGDGINNRTTARIFLSDGSTKDSVLNYNSNGTLQSQTWVVTKANGLSSTQFFDYDGNGNYNDAVKQDTVVNADGSTSVATRQYTRDDISFSEVTTDQRTVTTSASGLTITTAIDDDGNGSNDFVITDVTQIQATGQVVQTVTVRNADTSLREQKIVTTSPDRLSQTITHDKTGDGASDQTTVRMEALNGSVTEVVSNFNTSGALTSKFTTLTSANGLTQTTTNDRNGDATTDITRTSAAILNSDGSVTTAVTDANGAGKLLSKIVTNTSDDGLVVTVQEDRNGDGTSELLSSSTSVLNADGSVTTTTSVTDAAGNLRDRAVSSASANGLNATSQVDLNGDGSFDHSTTYVEAADLSSMQTSTFRKLSGASYQIDMEIVSADGRTSTLNQDLDANGITDRVISRALDASNSTIAEFRNLNSLGATTQKVTVTTSSNGLTETSAIDVNGDGAVEITRIIGTVFPNGGQRSEYVAYQDSTGDIFASQEFTIDPNGFTWVRRTDYFGDGTTDEESQFVRQLLTDGRDVSTITTTDATGKVVDKTVSTVSADGLNNRTVIDNDGNGNADRIVETILDVDGRSKIINTEFSAAGAQTSQVVRTTSSDGLFVQVDYSNGRRETTEISTQAKGSYTWTETTSTTITVSKHSYDLTGIDQWSVTVGAVAFTAALDQASKNLVFGLAERLFDTLLDRDMYKAEQETLAKYLVEGALDQSKLAGDIIASAEFASKYGTLSNASYVT